MVRAGLDQIDDVDRREVARSVARSAFASWQRYMVVMLMLAVATGVLAALAAAGLGLAAPAAIGTVVGSMSVVPYVGTVAGSVPLLLLAGAGSWGDAAWLLAGVLLVQYAHTVVNRQLVTVSVYVGPLVSVVAITVGFDVYGVGGAFFGMAIAVGGLALLDALAQSGSLDERQAPS